MRLIKGNVERIADYADKVARLKADGFEEIEMSGTACTDKATVDIDIDIESMSTANLRMLAKEKGLTGCSSLTKAELLTALKDVI